MSDTENSIERDLETVTKFRNNPVGFTVELQDGLRREVFGFRDTPKGRWLRLSRSPFGPWVPESQVAAVITFTVSIRPDYLPGGPRGPEVLR